MNENPKIGTSAENYIKMSSNCSEFRHSRGYIRQPLSVEEAEFPIAYNLLVHRDIEHVERLLRVIYHPQSSYCVHVDLNAPHSLLRAIQSIADCFPNVFVASKLEHVAYAGFSRLMADINCLKDQLKVSIKWKYLLNAAGQSFPLKTNHELVQILKAYNGANDIEGFYGNSVLRDRFELEYAEVGKKTIHVSGKQHCMKLGISSL